MIKHSLQSPLSRCEVWHDVGLSGAELEPRHLSVIRVIWPVSVTVRDRRGTFPLFVSCYLPLHVWPRAENYLCEMFWCSRCGHNHVNLSLCCSDWFECCYFSRTCPMSAPWSVKTRHNMTPVNVPCCRPGSDVRVRGYCRRSSEAQVTRHCCYFLWLSLALLTSNSPTSGNKQNIGRGHGEHRAVLTWPIWREPGAALPRTELLQGGVPYI